MANWLDLSSTSNMLKAAYVKGFVDISGGDFIARTGNLYIQGTSSLVGAVTICGELRAVYPAGSIPSNAIVGGAGISPTADVSLTQRLFVSGDVSLNSKLYVAGAATFAGIPTAPTATAGTNTTQIATTAFVKSAVDGLVSSAPAALDTLNELAAALGNDAAFSTTVTNSLAAKAPLANPALTGVPTAPTATAGTNTTQLATTAFVTSAVALKPSFSQVDVSLALKPSFAQVDASMNLKSNITYVDASLNLKPSFSQVDASLNLKSNLTYVDASLNLKSNLTYVDASLNLKSNITYVDASLNLKSSIAYVDSSLNLKSNLTYVDSSLNLKSNLTYVDASLNLKANLVSPTFTGPFVVESGDVSMNNNLSLGGNLVVKGNLTVFRQENASIINTTVNNYEIVITKDISLNGKLYVASDASLNSKLYVANDVSLNSKLYVANDVSLNSKLAVGNDASFNMRVDICGNLYAQYPAASIPVSAVNSLSSVFSQIDASLNLKSDITYVDASFNLKAPINNPTFTGTVGGITKGMVGLGNADNTSDANKPISTATQSALDLKANISAVDASLNLKADIASPTFTGTVGGITKGMVGLGNADNTSDANKPISTATQSALDLKANISAVDASLNLKADLASPTLTGTPSAPTAAASTNSTQIATTEFVKTAVANLVATAPSTLDTLNELALALGSDASFSTTVSNAIGLKAPINNPTFTGTVGGISKSMVGLGNADNTSDVNKPISTATQSALDLKANLSSVDASLNLKADLASPTFTGTVGGISKSMVGLGNADNTSDVNKPISTATQSALDLKASISNTDASLNLKANLASPTFTGTVSGISKSMVGLGNADDTSDANKPISTATQTALNLKASISNVDASLNLKADLASPTFTGTVSGISKSMVGLGNADDTSDVNKPISTATQNALNLKASIINVDASLNLKADLASPVLTGTPSAPTAAASTNSTQIATTEFVKTAVANLVASAPSTLDTLNELALALGSDASFSTTVSNAIGLKAPINNPTFTGTVSGIAKSMVGLGNADDTSDANKPISTAAQSALNLKANISTVDASLNLKADLASPTFTGTVGGISKSMVGLGNADNTSDVNKPISTATQSALNLKANISAVDASLNLKADLASPTFTGTVGGISKSMVGLGNADNTSDVNKPISTATQSALNLKASISTVDASLNLKADLASPALTGIPSAPTAAASTNSTQIATTEFVKTAVANLVASAPATLDTLNELALALGSDASFSTTVSNAIGLKAPIDNPTFTGTVGGITKSMVGLGNADDTSDANKPISTATQSALNLKASISNVDASLNLKANIASPTFTGTVGGITKSMVGLGNADDTSDANKPISTATQTALNLKASISNVDASLNLKANIASPTFTGTVSGITKSMIGLGNADDTSDANKPISTATQTALNLKASISNVDASFSTYKTTVDNSFSSVDTIKANKASPIFTGIVTAPKLTSGDASFNGRVDISGVLSVTQTVNSVVTNTTINNYNVNVTNDLSLNGKFLVSGDVSFNSKLFVSNTITISGDIIPQTANQSNLGSADKPFKSLFVSNNTINLIGTDSTTGNPTTTGISVDNGKMKITTPSGPEQQVVVTLHNRTGFGMDSSFANATIDVSGTAIIRGDVSFNRKLYVGGDASFNGRVDICGNFYAKYPAASIPSSSIDLSVDLSVNGLTIGCGTNDISTNSVVGYQALLSNTTGYQNSGFGFQALNKNTSGYLNSAVGYQALLNNTTGSANAAVGYQALLNNASSSYNSGFGNNAGQYNKTGTYNTFLGANADVDSSGNTWTSSSAIGANAKITASNQITLGVAATNVNILGTLNNVTVGRGAGNISTNSAYGYTVLNANTTGSYNSAFGNYALTSNTTGGQNCAAGNYSLYFNNGSNNTALGYYSGTYNSTGSYNTFLGSNADISPTSATWTSSTAIGANALITASNQITLGVATTNVNILGTLNNVTVGRGGGSVVSNSAYGNLALSSNTSGNNNSAFGSQALDANTTGTVNSAFGLKALMNNVSGTQNCAFGSTALMNNTGSQNSGFGQSALYLTTNGTNNAAIGFNAGINNTTGSYNTFLGSLTDISPTNATWTSSTAIGANALITASNQITLGVAATNVNILGTLNTLTVGRGAGNVATNSAFGYLTLSSNTSGLQNSGFGYQALDNNTTGNYNSAFGYNSLFTNTSGISNCAFGAYALFDNTAGWNTAFGTDSLNNNSTGTFNNASGYLAGTNNTTGSYNTFLGSYTNISPTNATWTSSTAIGANALITASNQITLGTATELVRVPGKLSIASDASFSGRLDICGNIFARTAAAGTNTTQLATTEFVTLANSTYKTIVDTSLNLKANLASPTFTGTVGGITNSMVGLANVDNTSDANKPISTATQTALDLKAALASPTFTGTPTAPTASYDNSSNQLATTGFVQSRISAIINSAPAALDTLNELAAALGNDANYAATITTSLSLKAPLENPTFTGTVNGITKSMVGLANVDNTSDANKPISTATQTALDLKAAISYVDPSLNLKANLANPTFTGTVSGITKIMVGLGNVDNTADTSKPISGATQTALDLKAAISYVDPSLNLKANLANPTFTGTVSGITKSMVGLGSVDNTSDTSKPISTATQNALDLKSSITYVDASLNLKPRFSQVDASLNLKPSFSQVDASLNLKANLVSPTFTGTVTLPKITSGDASFNGNVDISGVLSVTSTINTSVKNTTINNYNVAVTNDLSLNGKLLVSSDVSLNSKLYVNGDVGISGEYIRFANSHLRNNATNSRLEYNVNTGYSHSKRINNVEKLAIKDDGNGATLQLPSSSIREYTPWSQLQFDTSANYTYAFNIGGAVQVGIDSGYGFTLEQNLNMKPDKKVSWNYGGSEAYITKNTTALTLENAVATGYKHSWLVNNVEGMSLGSKLIVGSDSSFNSKLSVGSDVSFNSKLYVGRDASFNGRVDICGNFYAQYPASSIPSSAIIGGVGSGGGGGGSSATDISVNSLTVGRGSGDVSSNSAYGYQALLSNTTGANNTAIGYQAGDLNTTGSNNTFLGSLAGATSNGLSNSTAIGYNAKFTASNQITLGVTSTTVRVPGKLLVISDASFNGRVDICGNFYAQYPAASIPISAINGISSPTFAQVDASLNLKSNLASPTFTGIATLPKVISGDASFNGRVDISGVLSVTQTTNSVVTNTTINNYNVIVTNDISLNGNLKASGQITATNFSSSSDYRIKSNVISLSDCSFEIGALNPVTFHNKITNRDDIGFIAHELQSHFPFLVTGEKDGDEIQTVNYTGIIGLLVHELQQLKKNVIPQTDLIYRGSVQLTNGLAYVNLDNRFNMPEGTFAAFKDVAVFASNETGWDPVRGRVSGNILTIECNVENANTTVSYLIAAKPK